MPELPKSSGRARLGEARRRRRPWTRQAPVAGALDRGAERPHGLAGVDHVLAFEQAVIRVSPTASAPEDQRAVRDRLVARHAHAALERAGAAGGQRRGLGGMVHGRASFHGSARVLPRAAVRHRARRRPNMPAFGRREPLLTAAQRAAKSKHRFSKHRRGTLDRGKTRARHQAPVRQLRREVLRPRQGPDRLPEMRHGRSDAVAATRARGPSRRAPRARRAGGRGSRGAGGRRRPNSSRSRRPTPRPQGKKARGRGRRRRRGRESRSRTTADDATFLEEHEERRRRRHRHHRRRIEDEEET